MDFMIRLAYSLRGLTSDDLHFTTVPWEYSEDRYDVYLADEAPQMFDDIRHDRPLSVEPEGDSTSKWDPHGDTTESPVAPSDPTDGTEPDTIDDILASCGT